MDAALIILILKVAVVAVTLLLVASLAALACGNIRLHGRINYAFFVLTIAALLGLEVVARLISPQIFLEHFDRHGARDALRIHLMFSIPSAVLLVAMLGTGLRRWRRAHIAIGLMFLALWIGTFVTGIFYLPHTAAP
ncbi:MAG: DUF420 domain-containing protein [Gemmataceae bacterium]